MVHSQETPYKPWGSSLALAGSSQVSRNVQPLTTQYAPTNSYRNIIQNFLSIKSRVNAKNTTPAPYKYIIDMEIVPFVENG